jgi:hypothetical protein
MPEQNTKTDTSGIYSFHGLANGTYNVRQLTPTGWVATAPAGDVHAVTISSPADSVNGKHFGQSRNIRGTVYEDGNVNGTREADEPVIAGTTVFIDSDNSGGLDPGEPSTITDSNGDYAFGITAAGTYKIRRILSNYSLSAPAAGLQSISITTPATESSLAATSVISNRFAAQFSTIWISTARRLRLPLAQRDCHVDSNDNYVLISASRWRSPTSLRLFPRGTAGRYIQFARLTTFRFRHLRRVAGTQITVTSATTDIPPVRTSETFDKCAARSSKMPTEMPPLTPTKCSFRASRSMSISTATRLDALEPVAITDGNGDYSVGSLPGLTSYGAVSGLFSFRSDESRRRTHNNDCESMPIISATRTRQL